MSVHIENNSKTIGWKSKSFQFCWLEAALYNGHLVGELGNGRAQSDFQKKKKKNTKTKYEKTLDVVDNELTQTSSTYCGCIPTLLHKYRMLF